MTPPQEGGGIDTAAIRAEYEKININPGTRGVINELCDVIDAVLASHNAPTWPEIADQRGICAEVRPCPTVRAATGAPSRRPPMSDASSLTASGVPSPQEEHPAEQWAICTCTACGNSGQCTPWSDYYTIPEDAAALLCEGCFAVNIGMRMIRVQLEES